MTKDQEQPEASQKPEPPEFEAEYFWAFVAFMLYRIGGTCVLTDENIKRFQMVDEAPEVLYDHDKEAWIMKLKDEHKPTIVTVPKKMLKKMPKFFRS